jgi:hypothetical protein
VFISPVFNFLIIKIRDRKEGQEKGGKPVGFARRGRASCTEIKKDMMRYFYMYFILI